MSTFAWPSQAMICNEIYWLVKFDEAISSSRSGHWPLYQSLFGGWTSQIIIAPKANDGNMNPQNRKAAVQWGESRVINVLMPPARQRQLTRSDNSDNQINNDKHNCALRGRRIIIIVIALKKAYLYIQCNSVQLHRDTILPIFTTLPGAPVIGDPRKPVYMYGGALVDDESEGLCESEIPIRFVFPLLMRSAWWDLPRILASRPRSDFHRCM